jgi:hypothetical protein
MAHSPYRTRWRAEKAAMSRIDEPFVSRFFGTRDLGPHLDKLHEHTRNAPAATAPDKEKKTWKTKGEQLYREVLRGEENYSLTIQRYARGAIRDFPCLDQQGGRTFLTARRVLIEQCNTCKQAYQEKSRDLGFR